MKESLKMSNQMEEESIAFQMALTTTESSKTTKRMEGTFLFADGVTYEGEFKDDRMDGRGSYHFANGDVYEGEFQYNKRNGTGVLRFANGDVYEGEYKADKRKQL